MFNHNETQNLPNIQFKETKNREKSEQDEVLFCFQQSCQHLLDDPSAVLIPPRNFDFAPHVDKSGTAS